MFSGKLMHCSTMLSREDSGRIIPEFPDLPHREVIISPYRFFYRVEKKTVWIVAVWHGAQEVDNPGGAV